MKLAIVIVAVLAGPVSAEDAAMTGNVLIWADAPLYPDPSATGPSVRVGTLDQGREHDVGYVVPMKIVSTTGDLVEVEPTPDVECVWWRMNKPDGLGGLRLYVRRADLAPVLTKPFTGKYKDGTTVTLQPGVPVLGGKVAFNRSIVSVTVPDASLGVAYTPKKIAAVPKPGKQPYLVDEMTDVKLGDATFSFGPWVATAAKKSGKRLLVSIAARCMSAVVSAPKERVHARIALGHGAAAEPAAPSKPVIASGKERYYLPAGTKLTSEKGEHVVGTLEVDRDVIKPAGKRACADFVITREDPFVDVPHTVDAPQPARTLKLCAPAEAVKVEKKS